MEEPFYTVRVKLDSQSVRAFGRDHALQPGMALNATVILERQSLLSWQLEPIQAIRARA
ncbi:hypothetical protein [Yunchengibacter salinarum]|uniref:hypothetical protein n=1 Tax=Yunchengibacter salinarum TaxID=3133399 RepID=UPI0035B62EE8